MNNIIDISSFSMKIYIQEYILYSISIKIENNEKNSDIDFLE